MKINSDIPGLTPENFTALPAGINAKQRLFAFRTLLKKNIIEYLSSIQVSLKDVDISFIIEKYKGLPVEDDFSPALYAAFTKLVQGCSSAVMSDIVNALHTLNIL